MTDGEALLLCGSGILHPFAIEDARVTFLDPGLSGLGLLGGGKVQQVTALSARGGTRCGRVADPATATDRQVSSPYSPFFLYTRT